MLRTSFHQQNDRYTGIHSFSTKYADRKSKLTHRERLYKNFNSTQIMIGRNYIEKTAKRMDARYVAINFQYANEPEISEIYVLSQWSAIA